jgi:hypothetical protein
MGLSVGASGGGGVGTVGLGVNVVLGEGETVGWRLGLGIGVGPGGSRSHPATIRATIKGKSASQRPARSVRRFLFIDMQCPVISSPAPEGASGFPR